MRTGFEVGKTYTSINRVTFTVDAINSVGLLGRFNSGGDCYMNLPSSSEWYEVKSTVKRTVYLSITKSGMVGCSLFPPDEFDYQYLFGVKKIDVEVEEGEGLEPNGSGKNK